MSSKTNLPIVDLGKNIINCLKLNDEINTVHIKDDLFYLNKINDSNKYGLKNGTYSFLNNNEEYPIGFVVSNDKVEILSGTYKGSGHVDGLNINFYTGKIVINVKKNFQFMSIYFLNKGYLGGEKRFVYTQLCSPMKCGCNTYQSYNKFTMGKEIKLCFLQSLWNNILCQNNQNAKLRKIIKQQDLYQLMRLHPEKFPITPWVQQMNLSISDQRRYSNMWYRQFGTSQALPVNDNWGGFYVVGSEVPYTN